jgi:Tfp pilus assembly protein PilF
MFIERFVRLSSACLVFGTVAAGCVTTTRDQSGSFTSGGSGTYGGPPPGTDLPAETTTSFAALFGGKKADPQKNAKLHLAYAAHEETKGNEAGVRHASEEQRASYDAARKAYQHVLTLNDKSVEVDAVIGLARLDEVAGRVGEAEQGFKKAARLESDSPRSLDALGQFYSAQSRWSDALPTLQRAVSASPDDKAIRYHYAIALAKSGQLEQAKPQLVQAVGSATAHYNIGILLHEQGDLVGSEEQFSAALLENPRLEPAQNWLKEVRRELNERTRLAQAGPPSSEKPSAAATAGHAAANVVQPVGARPPAATQPPSGRQPASSTNQPRRIQPTSGVVSDETPSASQRPDVPVSPLPRQ